MSKAKQTNNSKTQAQETSTVDKAQTQAQEEKKTSETSIDDKVEKNTLHGVMNPPEYDTNQIAKYYSANGQVTYFESTLVLVSTATESQKDNAVTRAMEISTAYKQVSDGYFKLLPQIALAYWEETWKSFDGIKSLPQLVMAITGCAQSTASELSKVASVMYDNKGVLVSGYEFFNYSDLITLSKLDSVIRKAVRAQAEIEYKKGTKITRRVLANIVNDACLQHIALAPKAFRDRIDREERQQKELEAKQHKPQEQAQETSTVDKAQTQAQAQETSTVDKAQAQEELHAQGQETSTVDKAQAQEQAQETSTVDKAQEDNTQDAKSYATDLENPFEVNLTLDHVLQDFIDTADKYFKLKEGREAYTDDDIKNICNSESTTWELLKAYKLLRESIEMLINEYDLSGIDLKE